MNRDSTEMIKKLEFTKNLNHITNKISVADEVYEMLPDISKDICALFNADRVTIYKVRANKESLISIIKTGLHDFKDLLLPIAENSIAGFSALHRKMLNIKDVYDEQELASISPALHLLKEVDKRTGYHSKQMLVAPIMEGESGEQIGVIQIINNKSDVPFPALAEECVQELTQALAAAMRQEQQQLPKIKYSYLVEESIMSAAEFELAERTARRKDVDIEDVLLDEFQVKHAEIGKALSRYYGVPYEPFKADRATPAKLLKELPRMTLESDRWLPLEETPEGLIILTTNHEEVPSFKEVRSFSKDCKVIYKVCSQREFKATLDQFYGVSSASAGGHVEFVDPPMVTDPLETERDQIDIDQEEIITLANKIIISAYQMGASDIHIEPGVGKVKTIVRLRKDGMMINFSEVPWTHRDELVKHIINMCDLDIMEKRRPQKGKIQFKKFGPLDIELRVMIVPVHGGVVNVAIRILSSGEPIPLDNMGFTAHNLPLLKRTISRPYGLFLVCGPTGSGKLTTLHSILKHVNTPDINIWTAEDPVEIPHKGLHQVQVNKKAGLDFATAMQAILDSDPDVIMVSEQRDKEAANIVIDAALLGHLMFSTLHANNAPEAIIRLLDLDINLMNFTDAFLGVLAQRLAKRLCRDCKKPHIATKEEIKSLLTEYSSELVNTQSWNKDPNASVKSLFTEWVKQYGDEKGNITMYEKVGCQKCSGTGYRGRVGLHELLISSPALKNGILEKASTAELTSIALEEGMRTMKQDGIEKVLSGLTDMQIVRAVCEK